MIQKNQRVRLTESGVSFFCDCIGVPRRGHPNWGERTGTVRNITKDECRAVVIWDGNKRPSDAVPVKFLAGA